MPNCGGLPTSLRGTDSYPKDGLGSGIMDHGTRLKDHETLISLTPYPWIKQRDPWCTARGPVASARRWYGRVEYGAGSVLFVLSVLSIF